MLQHSEITVWWMFNTYYYPSRNNPDNLAPFTPTYYTVVALSKKIINRKGGGGVKNDPLVRRMSVISHMVMLWSQKFLTLSINISTTRY